MSQPINNSNNINNSGTTPNKQPTVFSRPLPSTPTQINKPPINNNNTTPTSSSLPNTITTTTNSNSGAAAVGLNNGNNQQTTVIKSPPPLKPRAKTTIISPNSNNNSTLPPSQQQLSSSPSQPKFSPPALPKRDYINTPNSNVNNNNNNNTHVGSLPNSTPTQQPPPLSPKISHQPPPPPLMYQQPPTQQQQQHNLSTSAPAPNSPLLNYGNRPKPTVPSSPNKSTQSNNINEQNNNEHNNNNVDTITTTTTTTTTTSSTNSNTNNSHHTEEIPNNKSKRNSLGEQTSPTLEKMVLESQQQQQPPQLPQYKSSSSITSMMTSSTSSGQLASSVSSTSDDLSSQAGDDKDQEDGKKRSKPKLFPHQWAIGKLEKKEEKERKEHEKREEKERREKEKAEKKERKEKEKLEKRENKTKDKEERTLSRTSSSIASKLKNATLTRHQKSDSDDFNDYNSSSSNSSSYSPGIHSINNGGGSGSNININGGNKERTSITVSNTTPPSSSPLINGRDSIISSTGSLSGGSSISISNPSPNSSQIIDIASSPSLSSSPPLGGTSGSPSNVSSGSVRSAIHYETSRGLMTWGSASNGKLGFKVESKDQSQATPERLPNFNISDIVSISSGSYFSAALTENGDVYMWGRGSIKNPPIPTLGIDQTTDQLLPIKVDSLTDIMVISLGFYHSAAVKSNGELLTWGCGEDGQLGHGDTQNQIFPKVVQALSRFHITQVQCGEKHTICLTKNGKVYTWGTSEYGQLGLGDTNIHSAPTIVSSLEKYNVIQVASGSTHCAVLTNSKEVLVFGNGAAMGAASIVSIPTLVPSLRYLHIEKISCGHYSTAALTECGDVYTWGSGQELGHGTNQSESQPKLVESIRNQSIRQISCGGRHTAFLTDSGRIFTCGRDPFGQLGHSSGDQNKPKKIESLSKTTFISVSCGENHNISLFDTTRSFRDKFCWKLLETQRTYVRSLDVIQTIFLNPLRVRDREQLPEPMKALPYIFLSDEEIRTLFQSIEKLYALNSTLLHVMNQRFYSWSNKKKIGDVLLNHFKHIDDCLNQYIDHLPFALMCLENLTKKQTSPFSGYLKECERLALDRKKLDTDDDTKEFTLRALLTEPLLVTLRYHKNINGMVKYTKTTHIDYTGLVDLDNLMEEKVNKVQTILNVIQNPQQLAAYCTSLVTATPTASSNDDSSSFLKEYDLKIESLQNFRKTTTKIIKSARKYFEVEPESFKEQGHFSEHLTTAKTCLDGSIESTLSHSLEHYSSAIKKIGYLRSELSTRTTSAFTQPLASVADELEEFIPLMIEMRKRVFEAHTEYESAVNKLYSLAKNLQPTDKKILEAEKEVNNLKKVLDKSVVDFEAIYKEGISIQSRSLKLFYACMKAQQEYFERGLQRFQAMKPSFDSLDTYFRQQSRAQWSKSIYDTLITTFKEGNTGTTSSGSNSSFKPSSGTVADRGEKVDKESNSTTTQQTPSSSSSLSVQQPAPSPLVLATSVPNSASSTLTTPTGSSSDSSPSSSLTTKDTSFILSSETVANADVAPQSKAPPMDPHQIMKELDESDWTFLLDPPLSNEFTETFVEDQYNQLVEILASPSLQVVQCVVSPITTVEEQGRTIESISRIFESFNKIRPIIHTGIEAEVASTANSSTLFRSNTTATKLMTAFTKWKGMPYLQKHITPLVKEIIENPYGYEVDPSKINEGSEELMTNMMNLIQVSEKFTDAIIDSLNSLPVSLREISKYLQQEVVKKFPDNKHSSVGGFIFLRFLCPAIIAPQTSGLVDEQPGPEATRALVLIGKVLQNLANGIEFGQKESFMIPVNRFIIGNLDRLYAYFDRLTDVPDYKGDYISSSSKEEVQKDIRNIHLLIVKNLSKIVKQLALYKQKEIIGQLSKTLVFLGDPTAIYK
eukprot:gene9133-11190_t